MAVDSFARDLAAAAYYEATTGEIGKYATLEGDNTFEGNQTINGNVTVNGRITEDNVRTELPQDGILVANTEYYLDELATLSCTFPTGEYGDYLFIKFISGSTPTTINILSNNYIGDIPVPIENKTYELIGLWNGEKWVFSYRGY